MLEDGRALAGLEVLLHPGELYLGENESFETPWAFASYSPKGLSELSRRFHDHIRGHVLRWPGGTMRPRPVTFNTWEVAFFQHDLET